MKLSLAEKALEGWTLNTSQGGLRAIIDFEGAEIDESGMILNAEVRVEVGDQGERRARIVWVKAEADGAIVGLAYLEGAEGPPPTAPPGIPFVPVGPEPSFRQGAHHVVQSANAQDSLVRHEVTKLGLGDLGGGSAASGSDEAKEDDGSGKKT